MDAFRYISSCGGCDISLPVFTGDPDCITYEQLKSQVCSIIVFPWLADKPDDWTDPDDWDGLIDNTNSNDTKAKKLKGIGSFLRIEQNDVSVANRRRLFVTDRVYELRMRVLDMHTGHVDFIRKLQCDFKNFDVYIETVGGRLIGGESGLQPFYVDGFFNFESDSESKEFMEVVMWFKIGKFPDYTDISGLTPSTDGDMNYYQQYPAQASNVMAFTGSSGVLPSNTQANCFLYQNGKKLAETAQYTLVAGVGTVTITVDANMHFTGANYEFIINT